jgi:uncharacterized phage-associated protein
MIANFILDHFDADLCAISNKKINKLLFYVHGCALVRLGSGLVRNHFEAWDHGPVVEVVYLAFKVHVSGPIISRATSFNYVTGQSEVVLYDDILDNHRSFITRVTEHYIQCSADELEAMTHKPDTPWTAVRCMSSLDRGIRNRIPNTLIEHYFRHRLGQSKTVN